MHNQLVQKIVENKKSKNNSTDSSMEINTSIKIREEYKDDGIVESSVID